MSSIPNLNTVRVRRGGTRRRGFRGGHAIPAGANDATPAEWGEDAGPAAKDKVIQQTDHDASSSRLSAVALGYLDDPFAAALSGADEPAARRYPIINRGTYVRTQAIDQLVIRFLATEPAQKKQIVSLGAGSDTRFLRLHVAGHLQGAQVAYHELDFQPNVARKRSALESNSQLAGLLREAEQSGSSYHLHALDLRDLTSQTEQGTIPDLVSDRSTLLLSECCLCYLMPDAAAEILAYFRAAVPTAGLAVVLYEPIRPFDAFGRTMTSNLASRGIELQTVRRHATLEGQRMRLRVGGFDDGQGARDMHQLWESDAWVGETERARVERLEWLDEVEEWKLLARHYCVAWGWRGDVFGQAWAALDGSRTSDEDKDDEMG